MVSNINKNDNACCGVLCLLIRPYDTFKSGELYFNDIARSVLVN